MIDDRERRASPQARICFQSPLTSKRPLKLISLKRHIITDIFEYNVSSIFLMRQNILDFPCYREREFFILLGIFRLERVVRETEMCSVIVWLLW